MRLPGEEKPDPTGKPAGPRAVQRVLIIEGLANITVLAAKLVVGIATNSAAILSDALHSLTDVANNAIAFIAIKVASEPPDREHPYGHRKYEQLAIFVLATLLTVIAIEILLGAVERYGNPIKHSNWALAVMLGVLLINIAVASWEQVKSKELNSELLHADARHTLGDIGTTVAVIIGWQLGARGFPWLDLLFAMLVAAFVAYLAFGLFQRAIPALVDSAVKDEEEITDTIRENPSVLDVRRVRSRTGGAGFSADVVVTVDSGLSIGDSHEIADAIEDALADRHGIHDVTVHFEPQERDG